MTDAKKDARTPAADGVKLTSAATITLPASTAQDARDITAGKTAAPIPAGAKSGDWLDARMDADAARLAALPANRYSIQLMTAHSAEKSAIESFLRNASRELSPDRIMIYPAGTKDNPRVSVLFGNFVERADAIEEMQRLSSKLTKFRPYVRSVSAVREDIRSQGG